MLGDVADRLTGAVETFGYAGVALATAVETMCPPLASVALPAIGVAVGRGELGFAPAVAAATAGSLVGAWLLYGVAALAGTARLTQIVERHAWLRADAAAVARAETWFGQRADIAVSFGRCVPAVRSLVSLPAGLFRMPFGRFTVLTALGCSLWNAALIGAGTLVGSADQEHQLLLGAALFLVGFGVGVLWLLRLRRGSRSRRSPHGRSGSRHVDLARSDRNMARAGPGAQRGVRQDDRV